MKEIRARCCSAEVGSADNDRAVRNPDRSMGVFAGRLFGRQGRGHAVRGPCCGCQV